MQISGKNFVLQAITRLTFPIDDGLCTHFPTEVSLQHASEYSFEFSITKPIRAIDALNQTAADKKFLQKQSKEIDIFNNQRRSEEGKSASFSEIITSAREAIMGKADVSKKTGQGNQGNAAQKQRRMLSDATLKIVRKGLEEPNVTIVDIPGLVASGHGAHKMAKDLVDCYINNPRSIVLAVAHPANREVQDIFQIIETISDRLRNGLDVEGDAWILDAIKNGEDFDTHLTYGWFALRNLSPTERKEDPIHETRDKKELEFFKQLPWTSLKRPNNLGIKNLKDALTKMHNEHVTRSIPELIPEIDARLKNIVKRIDGLGQPRISFNDQMHFKIRKIVRDALEVFRDSMLSDFEERFNYKRPGFGLSSTDSRAWKADILKNPFLAKIHQCILDNRGKESTNEVNTSVLRSLWGEFTPKWKRRTEKLIESLVNSIDKKSIHDDARRELDLLINDENSGLIVTLNNWNVKTLETLSITRMTHMQETLEKIHRTDREMVKTQITSWVAQNKDIESIFITHDKLASYYETAMIRFVDNDRDGLNKIAGEDQKQLNERERLKHDKESLAEAMKKARGYGFPLEEQGLGLGLGYGGSL
ncbi:hypothetical protein SBOR_8056 [Sclerotinia borealis F-4128]|uniref:Uncharacterized protein n=1 Tax=Sclerotinia borealis (strain F-4128) TaxID=1432307 RepID=W9CAG0_SCLBF|nr:hypothetical protein SBOR_8056 [Sclerotinia borealis F-4128]